MINSINYMQREEGVKDEPQVAVWDATWRRYLRRKETLEEKLE